MVDPPAALQAVLAALDQIGLRQRRESIGKLAKPWRIAAVNDDPHAGVQFLVPSDVNVGGRVLAEQSFDLEPCFFLDGEIAQRRFENLADSRDRQAIENEHTLRLCRRFDDVAFEMPLKGGEIDRLSRRRDNEKDRHFASILIRHAHGRADLNARKFVGESSIAAGSILCPLRTMRSLARPVKISRSSSVR